MRKKILLAANISNDFRIFLEAKEYSFVDFDPLNIDYSVQGIVTSTKLKLNAETLSKFKELKWVARLGSGLEIIDLDFCKKNNIAFASSPAGIANAVAEHCIAFLISLKKNIASSFSEVQQNIWSREPNRGWELEGSTVGLIGYGNTGAAFAKKLKAFDTKTIAFDKYKKDFSDAYVTEVSLEQLKEQADIISFHVPLNEETTHYYDNNFIADTQEHILLNTSRGLIVSTKDLLEGLQQKKVRAAALDVLENEQHLADPDSDHWEVVKELLKEDVLITPHIAGYSFDAIEKMSQELLEKLKNDF